MIAWSRDPLMIEKCQDVLDTLDLTLQNYNPLRKQTLEKMLDGQTICFAHKEVVRFPSKNLY